MFINLLGLLNFLKLVLSYPYVWYRLVAETKTVYQVLLQFVLQQLPFVKMYLGAVQKRSTFALSTETKKIKWL